ncbi:MAG: hypothetical protein B7Y84_03235 [Azorhizobium sp. 32-67-21]|nr:MAG: hypothetical protein B7Y84_03235 [Azorhizobium sp. 32-67-21]
MSQPATAPSAHGASQTTALDIAIAAVKPAMWSVIAFSFFINVLGLTGSIYMMQVYDRVLSSRSIQTLVLLTLIVAILYAIGAALEGLRTQMLTRAGVKFDDGVKEAAFDAVQRASLRRPSPGHVQALRDVDTVRDFFAGPGLIAFCDVPWVPIYIIFATLLHPYYGILVVIACVVSGGLAFANDRATRPILDRATKAHISANNQALTTFRNAEVLQAMGMVGQLRQRWSQHRAAAMGWHGLAADRAAFLVSATKFNRVFMQSLILGRPLHPAHRGGHRQLEERGFRPLRLPAGAGAPAHPAAGGAAHPPARSDRRATGGKPGGSGPRPRGSGSARGELRGSGGVHPRRHRPERGGQVQPCPHAGRRVAAGGRGCSPRRIGACALGAGPARPLAGLPAAGRGAVFRLHRREYLPLRHPR